MDKLKSNGDVTEDTAEQKIRISHHRVVNDKGKPNLK